MTKEEFESFYRVFAAAAKEVLFGKMEDYADAGDQLRNFKDCGSLLGVSPLMIHAVYFYKHVAAVLAYARTGVEGMEAIKDRYLDVANYAVLGAALAESTAGLGADVSQAEAGGEVRKGAVDNLHTVLAESLAGAVRELRGEDLREVFKQVAQPPLCD